MAINKKKTAAKKSAPVKKSAVKKPAVKKSIKKASKPAAKSAKSSKPAMKSKSAKSSKAVVKAKSVTKPVAKSGAGKPASRAAVAPKLSNAAIEKLLTPLDDRIVIDVEEPPTQTAGGIFMPESNERPSRGVVIAKGQGKRLKKGMLRPLDVHIGDTVLFSQFSGTPVTLEGRDFLIMREDEILGVSE